MEEVLLKLTFSLWFVADLEEEVINETKVKGLKFFWRVFEALYKKNDILKF